MEKSSNGCGRVLVVEDHEPSRVSLARLLKLNGRHVETAETVDEAILKIESFRPECVILDLRVGLGRGEDVLRAIRDQRLPIRVSIVTGSADPEDLKSLKPLRPDNVMFKPISFTDLMKWVDSTAAVN